MIYRFGELFNIIDGDRGKNYPKDDDFFDDEYCLFLNAGNVTKEGWSFENNSFITVEKDNQLRKGKVERGNTVLTTRGTVGNAAYYGDRVKYEHMRINSGMVILTPKDTNIVEDEFIYYLVISPIAKRTIELFCSGSAQPQLPIKDFIKIKYDLPDLDKQKEIVNILSTYDALIELNTKRIKTLEQMSENLYKEWFVRFRFPGHENAEFENGIPKVWEYKTAADLSSVLQRGISPDYDDEGEYTVISQKCIRTNIMDIRESRRQTKAFKPELNLQDADTVICSTGTGTLGRVGRVIGSYPNTTFDSHVTLVRAKKNVSKQFLYGALKNTQTWFMNMGIGSTNQQELYISVIRKTKLLVPTDNLMKEYESIVKPIHDNIGILILDNDNLIKQRDLLLPRLMSGKLEV